MVAEKKPVDEAQYILQYLDSFDNSCLLRPDLVPGFVAKGATGLKKIAPSW